MKPDKDFMKDVRAGLAAIVSLLEQAQAADPLANWNAARVNETIGAHIANITSTMAREQLNGYMGDPDVDHLVQSCGIVIMAAVGICQLLNRSPAETIWKIVQHANTLHDIIAKRTEK